MAHVTFLLTCLFASAFAPQPDKRYRSDYEYNSRTDAFYKLHIESTRTWRAREICIIEGAKLMPPESQLDLVQLHAMFKRYPDLGPYVRVDNDGQPHESAEEEPLINMDTDDEDTGVIVGSGDCDVVSRKGEVESSRCHIPHPFICKVEAKDAAFDSHCDVYGGGYTYFPSTGSCYKIPRAAYNWDQAYAECKVENAHLVILNSETERAAVQNLTQHTPKVYGAGASYFFFAGYRAERTTDGTPRVFKTVMNQTLEEAGFTLWSENEPNNHMDREYCGSIFSNDGKLNDLNCRDEFGFICEKEVKLVTT